MHKLILLVSLVVYVECNGVIPAAVKSTTNVEVIPLDLPQDPIEPQIIDVPAIEIPVKIIFNSRSSRVIVEQYHQPGEKGQVESTSSQEEPHRVIHEVVRPVIQEVRELIQPYRRVVQEVQPVIEEVNTIVAAGNGRPNAGNGGNNGRGNGGGQGGALSGLYLNGGYDDLDSSENLGKRVAQIGAQSAKSSLWASAKATSRARAAAAAAASS